MENQTNGNQQNQNNNSSKNKEKEQNMVSKQNKGNKEKGNQEQTAVEQFAKTVFKVGDSSTPYDIKEKAIEQKSKSFMQSEIVAVDTSRSTEGVTNQIQLSNYLEIDKYEVLEFKNDKETVNGLAFLMSDATVRAELSKVLTKIDLIMDIFKRALSLKNDQIRLENPLTDFRAINDAIREKKDEVKSSDTRSILAYLIYRACEDWNLLFSTRIFTEIIIRDTSRDEKSIAKYIQERKSHELLSQVKFSDITKHGKYTIVRILATTLIDDLSNFRTGLDAMSELDSAFDCVLPRVYSYVMKTVQTDYKQHERGFVDTAAFKFLATTADIVHMAVSRNKKKTTIPQSMWSFYDNLLQEALHNASFIKIKPLDRVLGTFVTAPVYTFGKKKKYQIIAKNIKHTSGIKSYFKQTIGDFSELSPYSYFDGVLSDINKFAEYANAQSLVKLVYTCLGTFATDGQDPHNVYLMIDDYDKSILALALADFVYINDKGEYSYGVSSKFNPAVGDILNSVDRAFITKSRDLVIFSKCDNNKNPQDITKGTEITSHGEGVSLASDIFFAKDQRYAKVNEYTRANYTITTPFDVFYSTNVMGAESSAVHFRAIKSPRDLLNIDIAPNVVSTVPFLVSPILDTIIRSMQLIRDHLVKIHINTSGESVYSDDQYLTMLSRFFGSFFQPIVECDSVTAFNGYISRIIEEEIRNNDKITDSSLKARDTLYYNSIVDCSINFGIAMYLLVSFGLIPLATYDTYRVMMHKFYLIHSVLYNTGMEVTNGK